MIAAVSYYTHHENKIAERELEGERREYRRQLRAARWKQRRSIKQRLAEVEQATPRRRSPLKAAAVAAGFAAGVYGVIFGIMWSVSALMPVSTSSATNQQAIAEQYGIVADVEYPIVSVMPFSHVKREGSFLGGFDTYPVEYLRITYLNGSNTNVITVVRDRVTFTDGDNAISFQVKNPDELNYWGNYRKVSEPASCQFVMTGIWPACERTVVSRTFVTTDDTPSLNKLVYWGGLTINLAIDEPLVG